MNKHRDCMQSEGARSRRLSATEQMDSRLRIRRDLKRATESLGFCGQNVTERRRTEFSRSVNER